MEEICSAGFRCLSAPSCVRFGHQNRTFGDACSMSSWSSISRPLKRLASKSADAARSCRRGDRVSRRHFITLLGDGGCGCSRRRGHGMAGPPLSTNWSAFRSIAGAAGFGTAKKSPAWLAGLRGEESRPGREVRSTKKDQRRICSSAVTLITKICFVPSSSPLVEKSAKTPAELGLLCFRGPKHGRH
jgi:hypothetical protein